MANTSTNPTQINKLNPSISVLNRNRWQYAETAYTIFAFTITMLLISLALRTIFALLVADNMFSRGLTVLTDPVTLPFARVFHDAHSMVQVSTALTFTFYYALYWIVALASTPFRTRISEQ